MDKQNFEQTLNQFINKNYEDSSETLKDFQFKLVLGLFNELDILDEDTKVETTYLIKSSWGDIYKVYITRNNFTGAHTITDWHFE